MVSCPVAISQQIFKETWGCVFSLTLGIDTLQQTFPQLFYPKFLEKLPQLYYLDVTHQPQTHFKQTCFSSIIMTSCIFKSLWKMSFCLVFNLAMFMHLHPCTTSLRISWDTPKKERFGSVFRRVFSFGSPVSTRFWRSHDS